MRMSRRAFAALSVAALLAVGGCSTDAPAGGAIQTGASDASASVVQFGPDLELADLLDEDGDVAFDARTLIDSLDALPRAERPTALFASVRSDVLALSDGAGAEVTTAIPDGEFYVSIAPFATFTHECYYHSLTTCVGELYGEQMHVLVTADDGEVLLDDDVTAFDNGFLGLWLPAGITGEITITADAGTVTAPISTAPDAPTCITTLELT